MRGLRLLLPVVVVVALALLPGPASAGHFGHRAIVVVKPAPSVFPRTVDPWKVWGFVNRRHVFVHRSPAVFGSPAFAGSFFPSIVLAPPTVVYAPLPDTYMPASPPAMAVPSPPTVIEYPTGRYELRGDGVTTAYVWVWVPKPPPPPAAPPAPPPAPSEAPPAPSAAAPTAEPRPAGPPSEIYNWTDEQGVTHWTNKLQKIPERYRSQAQRLS